MSDIIVKKDKVTMNLEWSYSDDQGLLNAVRNAQELAALIEKDEQNEKDSQP